MPTAEHGFAPVVVAPTYNNERTLAALITGVRAAALPLIVVNDGSTDATASILNAHANQPGVRTEAHDANRGKARALATGFAAAAMQGYTHAATIDTDGQLPPDALPALLALARQHPRALVLGVRRWRIPNCPPRSLIGRAFSNTMVWCECGERVTDTQCGLRVYPLDLVRGAKCRAGGFAFETEIIARAVWGGWPVVQVPVECVYLPPAERVSHYRPGRDSLAALALHARLAITAVGVRGRRLWPARGGTPAASSGPPVPRARGR
jgi:glycosyltransferase involved in cell wall biosynthesis